MKKGLTKQDSAALKGAAILLMAFHHCYRSLDKFAAYEVEFFPFTQEQIIRIAVLMKICVGIFALVSGYGLMYSLMREKAQEEGLQYSAGRWIKKHLLSTLSGFWFVSVCSLAVLGIAGKISFGTWGEDLFSKITNILVDITGFSGVLDTKSLNGTWWYMGAAVVFIVLAPFLAEMIQRLGGLAVLLLIFLFPRVTGMGYQGGRSAVSFLMAFLIGMICCKYEIYQKFHRLSVLKVEVVDQILKCLILIVLILFACREYSVLAIDEYWEFHHAWLPFLVSLFVAEYLSNLKILYVILGFLGKHSMNIWLIHTFIRNYFGKYLWKIRYFPAAPIIMLLSALLLSICVEIIKKYSGYNQWITSIQKRIK